MIKAIIISATALLAPFDAAANIPRASYDHRYFLTKEVMLKHGLNGPVAMHAALIHQESLWRPGVSSSAGAQGLAQFMPKTAEWMPEIDTTLSNIDTFDARWSMRAMTRYTKWLHDRVDAIDECNKYSMTLSAYNGGLGWVYRDKRLALSAGRTNLIWIDNVALFSDRADWAFKENRDYVTKIMYQHQPLYVKAGWSNWGLCK